MLAEWALLQQPLHFPALGECQLDHSILSVFLNSAVKSYLAIALKALFVVQGTCDVCMLGSRCTAHKGLMQEFGQHLDTDQVLIQDRQWAKIASK